MKNYYNIPSIAESLKKDYLTGNMTLEEVAKELYRAGHMAYIDLEKAKIIIGVA